MEIMKGAESYSFKGNSNIGVLVIQGFTGTTNSVIYLANFLSKQGYHVECPRLSGHGTRWEDLNNIKYTDWINDVEEAYEKLKNRAKKVFVSGLSMGGTLSLYMLENHKEFKGGILINHIVLFKDPRAFLLPILKYFVKSTAGIASDIKDRTKKELAYDRVPTRGAYEMVKLLKNVRNNLRKVQQPLLIFKSGEDHVVPQENVD